MSKERRVFHDQLRALRALPGIQLQLAGQMQGLSGRRFQQSLAQGLTDAAEGDGLQVSGQEQAHMVAAHLIGLGNTDVGQGEAQK